MVIQFIVDQDKRFQKSIKDALKLVDDLTIPFVLITKSFFQGNKSIFAVRASSGKYADLKPGYKKAKASKFGFTYPVLKATGRLEKSITDPTSKDSIATILNKTTMILGSSIPYGPYLQFGTKHMAARPFILLGVEQVSPQALNTRVEIWQTIIADYVKQVSMQTIGKK